MRLLEEEYCYIIDGVFPDHIIAGFTKPNLEGNLPEDIKGALAFLGNDFSVSYLNQQHSDRINFVEEGGIYKGDGLFSAGENLALVVRTADCLPLFFYDIKKEIIGIVHMGWQGAVSGILNNIESDFSSAIVVAGVGMRQCCYQVGEDFLDYLNLSDFLIRKNDRLYFDPVGFVRKKTNKSSFFDLDICSFCSPYGFFSYRKTKCKDRTLSFIAKV
ncbi:MAG: polyphenol oxidase family protein [Candidatus Omnitrophota bacterium]|nr:MAG: polyphenol oxidase family protein [Candidatus Omnitrophota bacterium]